MRHNLARREIWGSYSLKNYHTHTFRCKHADGDVSDYAQAAVDKGLTVLGITDHTPLPDNRWLSIRMGVSALPAYAGAIDEVQAREPGLTILKGAECEWAPEYHGFFRDVLLGEYRFDYLILGCHFYPLRGRWRVVMAILRIPDTWRPTPSISPRQCNRVCSPLWPTH